jgi:hypothetical protein
MINENSNNSSNNLHMLFNDIKNINTSNILKGNNEYESL